MFARIPDKPLRHFRCAVGAAAIALAPHAGAVDLLVKITGLAEPLGSMGCALFAGPEGFPMNNSKARMLWQPASAGAMTCRFDKLEPGTYAVSIGHDVNGNQRVDTNFFGIPREQWGVSNNPRPALRAPTFDEAAFKVLAQAPEQTIAIEVAK